MRASCIICNTSDNCEEGADCNKCSAWICKECVLFECGNYYCPECVPESKSEPDSE